MSESSRTSESTVTGLSPSGVRRGEEILVGLQSRLARCTRRDCTARRAIAATAGIGLIAAATWLALPRPASTANREGGEVAVVPTPQPPPSRTTPPEPVAPAVAAHRTVTIRVVSDAGERLTVCGADSVGGSHTAGSASSPRVCLLDDRQLLSALSETGGTYGMVRVNGQTVVLKDNQPLVAEPPPTHRFTPAPAE
ncbi:MAG: hypothetical protein IT438_00745 [Phycisphaerales bacterium]|nr:hypothetical protein [Phycisphaerales bacterium]